ncbi:MAG: thiamine pyrophosphate-dependent enzyme, partial [Candidatus Gastranaerophilales bacterium]|nr:thiamine pyrophosphate-dependent enzyme [Candidatus Gastranaerophilales bacterium]
HALAKGASSMSVMAELFGKDTGMCHGIGGSMHLFDINLRFMGGYAIVGGGIPIATGLALAIKYKDEDIVCACFFGDGAVNQGAFHESLNLAKLWNLPVLFICENNLYAMGTDIAKASAVAEIYKRVEAYNIQAEAVNGMDVLEVKESTARAVRKVRKGNGPYFLELKTYRYRAHSMADPGRYRTIEEEEIWKERDPIETFARYLTETGVFEPDELKEIKESIEKEIQDAVKFADESPNPDFDLLTEFVYAE